MLDPDFDLAKLYRRSKTRLVYRRLTDGGISKIVETYKAPRFLLQDAWDGLYTTIDAARRDVQVRQDGKLVSRYSAGPKQQVYCAQLVPGHSAVVLCILNKGKRPPLGGTLVVWNYRTRKTVSQIRFAYKRKTYVTGRYFKKVRIPGGFHSIRFGKSAPARYDYFCRLKMKSPERVRCTNYYVRSLPREYAITAAVSHDGQYVVAIAFNDLVIFRLGAQLKLEKRIQDITYIDRDWNLTSPRLRFSSDGSKLLIFGWGRIIRIVALRGYSVADFYERTPIEYDSFRLYPYIGDVDFVASTQTIYYPRMNRREIGIKRLGVSTVKTLRLKCSKHLKSLCEDHGLYWPEFLRVSARSIFLVVGGQLRVVDRNTGVVNAAIGLNYYARYPQERFSEFYKRIVR
jgi:hypothetical protein